MTAATWPQAFASLLTHEGGYVNHPSDPGGRTNLGVTQRVWEEWVGHSVDEAAMRALTPALVEPLYRERYWDKIRGDNLPAGVDLAVMDYAVNSGVGRAARMLQQVVGAQQDGAIGPATLMAVNAIPPLALVERLCDARLGFLKALPTWPTFGKGWERRVREVRSEALRIAQGSAHGARL